MSDPVQAELIEPREFDAGDKADVRKRARESKRNETQRIDTLKTIMSAPNGRAYIWWLLGQCGVYRTSVSTDPHRTYFNEGQRNIGLMVFAELHEHCAGDYQRMVNEAQHIKESMNVPAKPDLS